MGVNEYVVPHPITLQRLAEMAESFKKEFPVLPKYYRVNQKTFDSLKAVAIPKVPRYPWHIDFSAVEFRIDDAVPDGEAWPPGKLSKDRQETDSNGTNP